MPVLHALSRRASAMARTPLVVLACAALAVISFWSSYGLFRFHDDWTFVYEAAAAVRTHRATWFILHPLEQHWSPAWHAIEVLNFVIAGWEDDWFIRTIIAAATFLSLVLCASFLRTLGVSAAGQLLGGATLALHHVAAAARFSFDTYSQSLADLLGWAAVVCVIRVLLRGRGASPATIARVLLLVTPALLLKEQALSAFAAIALVVIADAWWQRDAASLRRNAWLVGVVAIEAAAFAAVRAAMGVRFAATGSAFSLCFTCVPVNVIELMSAVLLPVRTLTWFDAIRAVPIDVTGAVTAVAGALAVAAAILAGVVVQIRQGGHRARALTLVMCALAASYFPVAMLGHVGELYTHTSLFWFAALVGCVGDALWTSSRGVGRAAVAVCAVIYVTGLGIGQHANLRDMRETGARARSWLTRIAERVQPVPDGALVVIRARGPYKARFDYGLYRLTTPQVLVLTGQSPPSIRHAVRERVAITLEDSELDGWPERIKTEIARGAAYRLDLVGNDAYLTPPARPAGAP